MTTQLILIRHGQSQWNLENRFTGWKDIDISEKGYEEAQQAGQLLLQSGIRPDIAYTSVLKRAIRTLWIVLDEMDLMWIPVVRSWRLNERHYGGLQGLDKAETAAQHGDEQVHIWRRSFDVPPPPMADDDPRHPRNDPRYADLAPDQLPATESLKLTLERVWPFWQSDILPQLQAGKNIIVAAHGNSLRALVKHLDSISDDDIPSLEIPTGKPMRYSFDANLNVVERGYLGE